MAEQLNLAQATGPTTTLWRVRRLVLERGLFSDAGSITLDPSRSSIEALLRGDNGTETSVRWTGQAADTLLIALNKANLSTTSLEKRVLNQAITDGKLSGTIAGSPD